MGQCSDQSNEDRHVVEEFQVGTLKGRECAFSFAISLTDSLEVDIRVQVPSAVPAHEVTLWMGASSLKC